MQIKKWAWLIIGNAALGLVTCYVTILLWVMYNFNKTGPFLSWKAGLSYLIGIVTFFIWNYFYLRKYEKKYWLHSIITYVGTILLFILLFYTII